MYRIRSQLIRESCGIQAINEWVERLRRKYDEDVTRMNAKRLVKISRDNITAGNQSLIKKKQAESPTIKNKNKKYIKIITLFLCCN